MTAAEEKIASHLVRAIVAAGYNVSIWDGADYPVTRSGDYSTIMNGLASSDCDNLFLRDAAGMNKGVIALAWGNHDALIYDYTHTPEIEALVRMAGVGT
jgi:hypothetical protein